MYGPISAIVLALACGCYGLPRSWDISHILQTLWGGVKDFGRGTSECVSQAFTAEGNESKDGLAGNVHAIGFGIEQSVSAPSQKTHHSLVIDDNYGWFYFTDIALGTPPQSFQAAVDINWSDTYVPSVDCQELACSDHRSYNHSQSTSYQENGTAVRMHYGGFYTSGYSSIDSLQVADLIIENQLFEEATLLKPIPVWDLPCDSVLGLARLQINDAESSVRAVSPFHNMIGQGLLEKNIFSLKLSDKAANCTGELLLGGINEDLYTGNLNSFPVSTASSTCRIAGYYLASGWQIDAHSVAYQFNGKPVENFTLSGYVAAFSTASWFIDLPREIGENIIKYLGAGILNEVDCDRRDSMPDLVFNLGQDGIPFVLKPHDYIRRHPQFKWSTTCVAEISVHDEPEDGTKYIVLGSVFLARWYSVFDYENAQISLAALSGK